MNLRNRIEAEINRLSSSHQEEDIYLINKVLRPMLEYIDAHEKILIDIARISGKHGV
jgi:hypothetical protein